MAHLIEVYTPGLWRHSVSDYWTHQWRNQVSRQVVVGRRNQGLTIDVAALCRTIDLCHWSSGERSPDSLLYDHCHSAVSSEIQLPVLRSRSTFEDLYYRSCTNRDKTCHWSSYTHDMRAGKWLRKNLDILGFFGFYNFCPIFHRLYI